MANSQRYLEITYRGGKPLAAYLYLARSAGAKSVRTAKRTDHLLIDFDANGHPIGIEILSPSSATIAALNEALRDLKQEPISMEEAAPLRAA